MDFVTSDEHSNISSCALSECLPGEIVRLMVLEFSSRLRVELVKLEDSIVNGSTAMRGRANTSDTGRMSESFDSIRSLESVGGVLHDYISGLDHEVQEYHDA